MSKLSSEYESRKSVSSIEPELKNVNELYDVGDYDGIKIVVEKELDRPSKKLLLSLVSKLYNVRFYSYFYPLVEKSVDEINIIFINYVFSSMPQVVCDGFFRHNYIRYIMDKGNPLLLNRIEKEIPDVVKMTYNDIAYILYDIYLLDTGLDIIDKNTSDLINSIDPLKYGNQDDDSGSDLLIMLLESGFELSSIALAEKGIKLKLEQIEQLKSEYPTLSNMLENPVFLK